ncbi:MAG: DUF4159 domain-containing protein [Devosiaceae bacterium]
MGALSFLAPLALVGLLVLPILWWLLRATPPQPASMPFPPLRLLAKLTKTEHTPNKTPWWLLLLRMALITCIILAFAGPVWRAADPIALPGDEDTPLLLVIETDWASASGWQDRMAKAERLVEAAHTADRPIGVIALPQPSASPPLPGDRAAALASLASLEPQPIALEDEHAVDLLNALLASQAWQDASLVWLGSGLVRGETLSDWRAALGSDHPFALAQTASPSLTLSLDGGADGPAAIVTAIDGAAAPLPRLVVANDISGRQLASASLLDEQGEIVERIAFDIPLELRNDIARIAITPTDHAGHVVLVDDRLERRRVGIVGGERRDQAQPLLAGSTYVERALGPIADIAVPRSGDTSGEIESLIEEGVSVIVLVDAASLLPATVSLLEAWMDDGGVLVRFASTSLIQSGDALVPVPLRAVDRQLGGALTWEEPQAIAPFTAQSPFSGLSIPQDVRIERQVLSEPGAALTSRTFAELEDATPLVTGVPRGDGHLVLFHITADTSWSNLPLSGLFIDMLDRLIALSVAGTGTGTAASTGEETALSARSTLNGFGILGAPPAHVEGLVVGVQVAEASLANPPGFYGSSSSPRALNLFDEPPNLAAATAESLAAQNIDLLDIGLDEATSLRPILLGLAALLALLDTAVALALSGTLAGLTGTRRMASVALLCGAAVILSPFSANQAHAQSSDQSPSDFSRLIAAANSTRLAFVITGDGDIDQRSREGLRGLSRILTQRTAFEPGEPMAIDPGVDELSFFPLIYWPMPNAPIAVSDQVISRIDAYMNNGGSILFDTRDEAINFASNSISPQTANLRALLAALDIPPLEPVPNDHVLTKSFYLLESFPGRFATGPLWVEALPDDAQNLDRPARGGDGVSPLMITGNDFASAWALSADGRPLYATSPPDPRQREFAYRTGINIGMYVMTGNYKADQVHIPALLERLVQ